MCGPGSEYAVHVNDRPLNVLISGAGIAGATLASLLGRQGHHVTVVERDDGVRSSGNPVDVRGDAFDVVEDLGLSPRLRDLATRVREVVFVDSAGRRVAGMATRRSQDREAEVPRAALVSMLIDAARQEAEFRFDDMIVGIGADQHGLDVTFDRAAPSRFDLVVGADGLHSAVRRLAFGPESDFVKHLGIYIGTVRLENALDHDDTVVVYNEPGVAAALHPGAGAPSAAFMFRSSVQINPRDPTAVEQNMRQVYADAGWRVPDLLAIYAAAADQTYFDAVSRVRVPAWSRGRSTLLGDAASCVSLFGEGSSSAISGAATLTRSLTMSQQDIPGALERYELMHRRLSNRGQRAATLASHILIPASRAGITLRNRGLRLTGHS